MSALLLEDALLKCVVTQVVSFSADISQGSVATHWGAVGSLLQIFSRFWQWKKFENWSIFDEVIKRTKVCESFWPPCRQDMQTGDICTETRQFLAHRKWRTKADRCSSSRQSRIRTSPGLENCSSRCSKRLQHFASSRRQNQRYLYKVAPKRNFP